MPVPATITIEGSRFIVSFLDLPIKGQDRLLVQDDFVGVADGATPVLAGPHDPGEFAADALAAIARHRSASLRHAVRRAIREVGIKMPDLAAAPSTALSIARTRSGSLEMGVLGDCLVVAQLHDGSVVMAPRDQRLLDLDAESSAIIREALSAGASFAEARLQITEHLQNQRRSMNQEGSSWTFAAEPDAADHLLEASAPSASVEAIFLCSDGFARLWDGLGVYPGVAELLEAARELGLIALGRLLREQEAADDPPRRVPRVSIYDDALAVLLERD